MTAAKACPVVLRLREESEILAFRHPVAGLQLVKGSIEPGETPEAAALRELAEEAGIDGARAGRAYDTLDIGGTDWHFVEVMTPVLPDAWVHHCADGGGQDFAFFWYRVADEPDPAQWHADFRIALGFVRAAVGG